jgi:hypothetical protein
MSKFPPDALVQLPPRTGGPSGQWWSDLCRDSAQPSSPPSRGN